MNVLIKNGLIVTSREVFKGDIKIVEGVITEIGRDLSRSGVDEVIDASNMLVFPGVIDEHVHMREPGLEYKDDFEHGTKAALKGGVTTVIEHPNTIPPVEDPGKLEFKAKLLGSKAYVDYALLGVLHDGNTHLFEDMVNAGALGFKVFMGPTTGNIPPPSDSSLYEILYKSGRSNVTIAFHAEDHSLVSYFTERVKSSGRYDPEAHIDARPPIVEEYAVVKIATLAKRTGGRALIVHLSSFEALKSLVKAKRIGVKIYGETCPHYILLDRDDYSKYGCLIKVNPPIRGGIHRLKLLDAVKNGLIDVMGSDHAPHTPEEKSRDVWSSASGFAGVQTLFPLMLDLALKGIISLNKIPELLSENPAKIWGLYPWKGSISINSSGDIVIIDPNSETIVSDEWLEYKYKLTPFKGWRLKGTIRYVILRGNIVYRDNVIVGKPLGKWIKPLIK